MPSPHGKLGTRALAHCLSLAALTMAQPSQIEGRLRAILHPKRRRTMTTPKMFVVALLAATTVLMPLAAVRPAAEAAGRVMTQVLAAPLARDSPASAVAHLKRLYPLIAVYRRRHGGQFPATFPNGLEADLEQHPNAYGLPDRGVGNFPQAAQFFGSRIDAGTGGPAYRVSYFMHGKRPNGTAVGDPKPPRTRDVYAYTNLFADTGFYLVLWDDGQVEKLPAKKALSVPAYDVIAAPTPHPTRPDDRQIAFPGQAGLPPPAQIRHLVAVPPPAKRQSAAYNFTWGKIPGNPEKAVAQLQQIYQWGQTYRTRHGGAYPRGSTDFLMDVANHPQAYGIAVGDGTSVFRKLQNPDVRYAEASLGQKMIPFILFPPRFDGQALGSPKPAGTRDVLASTAMYVLTNWKHGIPTGDVGFYLVLWDDGTVERVPPSQKLIVPLAGLVGKSMTRAALRRAARDGKAEWTYGFPGQAGLPGNTLTIAQARPVGIFPY